MRPSRKEIRLKEAASPREKVVGRRRTPLRSPRGRSQSRSPARGLRYGADEFFDLPEDTDADAPLRGRRSGARPAREESDDSDFCPDGRDATASASSSSAAELLSDSSSDGPTPVVPVRRRGRPPGSRGRRGRARLTAAQAAGTNNLPPLFPPAMQRGSRTLFIPTVAPQDDVPREEIPFDTLYRHWRVEDELRLVKTPGEEAPETLPPLPVQTLKPAPAAAVRPRPARDPTAGAPAGVGDSAPALPPFELPAGRHLAKAEPGESELWATVEYDADEQDCCWLERVNRARVSAGNSRAPLAFLEFVLDHVEKEWFELVKTLPRAAAAGDAPADDGVCAVCNDGECENANAIVFCDGCNLAVHQDCYGVPYIPEGQWLCRRCMVGAQSAVTCIFCPHTDGAFKQTVSNQWAHLLCAMWIPETGVSNPVYMEPIDGIDAIPASRWQLQCYICGRRTGACIQCSHKQCFQAFHATCARKAGLVLRMRHGDDHEMICSHRFCDKHTRGSAADVRAASQRVAVCRRQWRDAILPVVPPPTPPRKRENPIGLTTVEPPLRRPRTIDAYFRPVEPTATTAGSRWATPVPPALPQSAAALPKSAAFDHSRPVAPHRIVRLLEASPVWQQWAVTEKHALTVQLCQYWALKREARRGAPLLRRLHLEPWTTTASDVKQDDRAQGQRYEVLRGLRNGLEAARTLVDACRRRERLKLRRLRAIAEFLERLLAPWSGPCRQLLHDLAAVDRRRFFAEPVDPADVPDYYDVVRNPICFADIRRALDQCEIASVDQFEAAVRRLVANCYTYNRKDTPYYRAATKVESLLVARLPAVRAAVEARHGLLQRWLASGEASEHLSRLFSYHLSTADVASGLGVPLSKLLRVVPDSRSAVE